MDTPQRSELSTIERANEIKKDQGFYECEVSTFAEADLHQHLKGCTKNPGHKAFIPVNEFKREHLPVAYRDNKVFLFIKLMINLTVRVCVRYTSFDRPETFPGRDEPYPFYHHRGLDYLRTGTGFVLRVESFTDESSRKMGEEGKTCRFAQCKNSTTPRTQWFKVFMLSARHVVFDTHEAEHTTFQLFYESDKEKTKIQELKGKTASDCQGVALDNDICIVPSYIHDLELGKRLQKMSELFWNLHANLYLPGSTYGTERPLTVIVSHPHGCSKQVTVGEMTQRKEMLPEVIFWNETQIRKFVLTRYKYTTPTCPGSSGALVLVLDKEVKNFVHPHSQRSKDGFNVSGVSFDREIETVLAQSVYIEWPKLYKALLFHVHRYAPLWDRR